MIGMISALFVGLFFVMIAHSEPPSSSHPMVIDCGQATTTRPGVGNVFRGSVANEDYSFSARVPRGLTGWDGVSQEAPFHGFTIFLDSKMKACIVFEVHIRVDEKEGPRRPPAAILLRLGEAPAWQSISEGRVGNEGVTNISTSFSFKQLNQIDDGEVLLITPTSKLSESKHAYDELLRSLTFRR